MGKVKLTDGAGARSVNNLRHTSAGSPQHLMDNLFVMILLNAGPAGRMAAWHSIEPLLWLAA